MQVLPVLDVMCGEVVHGIGGRRQEYRRIESRLTSSSDPREVASALRQHFGLSELYIADLDAIQGGNPAWSLYRRLQELGFRLWVDGGVRALTQARHFAEEGIANIVVGLETVKGPDELGAIVQKFGERIVFSLDLLQGVPLGDRSAWGLQDVQAIVATGVQRGVRRLLVLDLADVGRNHGASTLDLLPLLHADYPHLEISAGGGVRGRSDVLELRDCGVRFALVSSALHDGRLTHADLEGL